MNTTSIQKVESNRFSRADLESKLLMVDDDMDMSALPKTNYIKSIVTSECTTMLLASRTTTEIFSLARSLMVNR